jgi:Na+/proline symporter
MSPILILLVVLGYFSLIMAVAWRTGRGAGNADFFIGGHRSPWLLVAFGMIGTSLSGVTFLSVPGVVGNLDSPNQQFGYMQVVFGYLVGYAFIAGVLMPLYYRLRLTSIYTYLDQRFGPASYRTGAAFFLISRTLGASFRIFLVTGVFQAFVLQPLGVPYFVTIAATLVLIWIYTHQGGIRTIVYTDALQTGFMLAAVVLTVLFIGRELGLSPGGWGAEIRSQGLGQVFFWDPKAPGYFWKQFLSGAAIATVMTGLDQDMMQKNNSCPDIRSAQKNMLVFSIVLVLVNVAFLTLGALLYSYAAARGIAIPASTDHLYPLLALEQFPVLYSAIFLIGLIAAAFSSADSALTALTTSFCVDILGMPAEDVVDPEDPNADQKPRPASRRTRFAIHAAFSGLVLLICYAFYAWSSGDVLGNLFKAAGFTYGPLLGLYFFGLFSKRRIRDAWAPVVCVAAVAICLALAGQAVLGPLLGLSESSVEAWQSTVDRLLNGYRFGFEILILNGILTSFGLLLISRPAKT